MDARARRSDRRLARSPIQPGPAAHLGLNIDGQGDALLIGCALAIAMPHIEPWARAAERWLDVAAVGTLVMLAAFGMSHLSRQIPGSGGYLVVALGSAALIVRLLTPPTTRTGNLLAQAFEWRPVVSLGVISYSVYLWHPVILRIAKEDMGLTSRPQQLVSAPLLLAAILGVSWASYRWVEQPFERLKARRVPDSGPDPAVVPAPVLVGEGA